MSIRSGIHLAKTKEEKHAVYRFRYEVYVEEMGRYRGIADHENRMLIEPEDEYSRISYAAEDGKLVGTARLTWGGDGPLPRRQIETYQLEPFLAELPPEAVSVGERGMIARHLRGSDLILEMMGSGLRFANEKRIQVTFWACEPHLLNLYLDLGHRTYSHYNINSPESGYLIPLLFMPEDVAYLKSLDSPLLEYVQNFGSDARVPAVVRRILSEGSAVTSRRLTSPGSYWGDVHEALRDLEGSRVSALHGLTEEEAARCLAKSNIIECDAGDRVLKKGGVARNMFVVLDGMLEVRDGGKPVAVMEPGDVFGEMAFLLGRPRSKDVYAVTGGVRVLSLSEGTIQKIIESDPVIAARLLLNISKMLCIRLLQQGESTRRLN